MKRFELIYNGVSSIFNASERGNGYTSKHNKAFSYWVVYTVRPSKTNTLGISKLFDETQGELEEVTNVDDFEDAVLKLNLEDHSPKRIYRCGTALVCLSNDFD